ncbi:MAG: GHKL domain-containing protein [Lachnospiraceae bacterium]|nr:GHKL domain-containing protein [Lachnospiraceae bacterium]
MITTLDILCVVFQALAYILAMIYFTGHSIREAVKTPVFYLTFIMADAILTCTGYSKTLSNENSGISLIITLIVYMLAVKADTKTSIKNAYISTLFGFIYVSLIECLLLSLVPLFGFEITADHPVNLPTDVALAMILPVAYFALKYIPVRKLKNKIKNSYYVIALLFFITFAYISIATQASLKDGSVIAGISNQLISIASFMLVILLILEEQSERRRNESLHYYETYLPIVEEMIKNVQMTQHSMKNQIMSIKGLVSTDANENDVKNTLQTLANSPTYSASVNYNFLHLDNKLLAGLLYQKLSYAKEHGKMLHYTIRQYTFSSALNDFDLIDVAGILIDNAIEHSENEDIYITIGQPANAKTSDFYIEVENAGPDATPDYIKQMLKKGHTSKKERHGHGYGMYILKNKVNKRNGNITIENIKRNNILMLKITVEV